MSVLRQRIKAFLRAEDGPTAVEYGLLLAMILGGAIVTMASYGDNVNDLWLTIVETTGQN